ncbi:uromodulin-like [Sphaeramia orbicularis]|uniref:uromodulin-like n=1 Tax=Sphaeramia orbicularis TaxID=375764 RepID=UPI00117C04C4|nr:uromodulin-like [Sphaeramia orbicularis]
MICDNKAWLSVTPCDPDKRCWGNGQCVIPRTCTISGSNIIGFFGNVSTITDRCAYILMSDAGVELLGIFRDRRRKDVSLLDHVIVRVVGAEFILGQGGRVQMNKSTLSIHSSAQMFHQVEFSKDQTGVTANLLTSTSHKVSVFFDGYTAQIYVEGDESDLQGSCVNSTVVKSDSASFSSCEDVHLEPPDLSINCPAMTTHCGLLKDPPFTSCHDHVDPKPYISACIATLCKYPAVDGLKCRFHDAYARACRLHINITLEGWSSKGRCRKSIFCPHVVCSAHEFCADGIGDGTRCFCRAIFASKYKSTNTLGESTICHQNSASLSLVGCLLEEKGINYSVLKLNDPSCRGHMDNHTHMLTFSFNETNTCGAEVTNNNSQIIFKNTIMIQSNTSGGIIRHNQFQLNFSCFYSQPDMKSITFRIIDSTVVQQIASGAWNYSLSMKAFTDANHYQPISANTRLLLGQRVWVELSTDGLDDKLVAVVIESCWATNQMSAIRGLRYNLIMNSCANPDDRTVTVTANGQGTSPYFSFNMFQFSGSSADVYLHCKLNLCGKTKNDKCIPICDQTATERRRRFVVSQYIDDNPAVITMIWTN